MTGYTGHVRIRVLKDKEGMCEMSEESRVPEGWEKLDRGRVIFDDDGRMKLLAHCKCGAGLWLRQWRFPFKSIFTGRCPVCGSLVVARIRKVIAERQEAEEDESRIRDVDILAAHVVDVAVREMDPVLFDAAEMLRELNEKHWSECWQIGQYSDECGELNSERDEFVHRVGGMVMDDAVKSLFDAMDKIGK